MADDRNREAPPPVGSTPLYAAQNYGAQNYGQPVYLGDQQQGYGGYPPPGAAAQGAAGLAHGGGYGAYGGGDIETGEGKYDSAPAGLGPDDIPMDKLMSNDLPIDIRHGFIRKVYALFGIELLITFGISMIFVFSDEAAKWLVVNFWLYLVCTILALIIIIALACCQGVQRSYPINIILAFTLSACFGVVIGALGATYETSTFMIAVGCTVGVVCAVTLFACQTKIDFTGMGGYLFVALIVLMIMGIVSIFYHNKIYELIYATFGCLLFSFYLVFDTQLIMGGKKNEISIDDYVMASIMLYTDTINLFIYILQIVGAASGD